MSALLIKNLRALVTCDGDGRVLNGASVLCEDGVIRYIGKPAEMPGADRVIDGTHMLCYPGLVNTHHHLYQMFSRNLPQVQSMELFDWLRALYGIWQKLDADVVYLSSLCGLGELIKHGCTTCFDHHYVFPAGTGDLLEAQFAAAKLLGVRMHASRGSMSLSKKDGGLPPDSVVQTTDEILRDSERAINKYHDASFGSFSQVALAPCSPFSVTGELMRETAALARKHGVRLHTHLCETRDEQDFTQEKFGMRPLEYMQSVDFIGPDVWYAHGIFFNDEELHTLAASGAGVAHCPISNMKLSSGVMRLADMLRLNIPVGLAVDGSASNDGSDMLEELRVCYLLHRLNNGADAPSGYDILKLATCGGARLLGRTDIGSIEVGKCADMFLVDSRRIELAGACFDPAAMLCTVGVKDAVDYTIAGGRIICENGRLTGVDEEQLSANAAAKVHSYIEL